MGTKASLFSQSILSDTWASIVRTKGGLRGFSRTLNRRLNPSTIAQCRIIKWPVPKYDADCTKPMRMQNKRNNNMQRERPLQTFPNPQRPLISQATLI